MSRRTKIIIKLTISFFHHLYQVMTTRNNLMTMITTTNSAHLIKNETMTMMMTTKTPRMSQKRKLGIRLTWMMMMIKKMICLAKTLDTLQLLEVTEPICSPSTILIRGTKISTYRLTTMMMMMMMMITLFKDGMLMIPSLFCRRRLAPKRTRKRRWDQI